MKAVCLSFDGIEIDLVWRIEFKPELNPFYDRKSVEEWGEDSPATYKIETLHEVLCLRDQERHDAERQSVSTTKIFPAYLKEK